VKCIEEDLNPCKFRQKDMYIICDGSVAKITDEDLVRVGFKLENKTFDTIMIFKTNVINIGKNTFGETSFRNIDIYNNTELQTIEENAFKKHEPLYDLKLNYNPKLKIDSIFSLYKALNPQNFFCDRPEYRRIASKRVQNS
jgi:hypothetical protein